MMKMNHLQYVWNNQTKDIWEVASDLKENAMQVDVYLQSVEDKGRVNDTSGRHKRSVLPAHRLMLAASSPFLNKILSEHYAEHHDTCVNVIVPNVSHETLLHILDFIYCGRTLENIPSSVRKDVVEAAKFLQINGMVNYFQPNNSLPDKKSKGRSIKIEQREDSLETMKVPPKKRGRKRKVLSQQSKIDSDLHVISNIIKEEVVDGMAFSESEDIRYGRCRRRIKSRYSSDIYEVSLPKKRCVTGKGFDVLIKKEEGTQEQNKEISHSSGAENLHTYALKLSSENMCVNPSSFHNTNNNDDGKRFEKLMEFATPEMDHVLDLRATKQDHLQPELVSLPQTQSSSTSTVSSVVIPNLFSTDTSYLQEPTEISCASFIDSSASIPTISKQHFQASPLTVATSSSVISQIGDLTVVSTPPLTRGPLQKYVPEICKPHEISNLNDDDEDEEPEEEDGLFKLQVLLKDCEDFPEAVTHHVNHPLRCSAGEDTEVRFEEPTDGLDIRQWISEEINSSTMPKMHSHLSAVLAEDCNSQDVTSSTSTAQISDYQEQQEDIQQDFDNGKVDNKDGESLDVTENEAIGKSGSCEETPENNAYEDEEKATYECNICGKVYPNLQSRRTHLKNYHKEAKQMCKHCGKMFTRRCDLYCHERRHNDANLPCKVCGKIFKLNKDLAAHMRIHSGGKHYSCTQCKKELTSFRNLKNHIANVHQKKRSHACHMCNKTYAKSMALQVHVRSVHTGERPFKCKTCSKAFCNPYLLKTHEVGHTGEQKYSCKVCQRRFSQYCNMINHQRVHSNERPFMCDICKERSFKTRESLRKHKWSHTGLKPLRCPHCSKEYRIKESFERHMLKCHDEVVHLPQIYFELSEKITVENTQNEMHSNIRKTVRNINDSVVVETPRIELTDTITNKLEDHKTLGASLPENIVPVVQFVSDVSPGRTTSIELDANDTEQLHLHSDDIQMSYPMLSTNPSQDDGDSTTLTTITDQISSDTDISHPIESLLHVTIPGTNSSVIMTEDGKVNILLDC